MLLRRAPLGSLPINRLELWNRCPVNLALAVNYHFYIKDSFPEEVAVHEIEDMHYSSLVASGDGP